MDKNIDFKKYKLTGDRERNLINGLKCLQDELTDILAPGLIYANPRGVIHTLSNMKTHLFPSDSFMHKLAGMVADEALEIVKEKNLIFSSEMNNAIAEAEKAELTPDRKSEPETNDNK